MHARWQGAFGWNADHGGLSRSVTIVPSEWRHLYLIRRGDNCVFPKRKSPHIQWQMARRNRL